MGAAENETLILAMRDDWTSSSPDLAGLFKEAGFDRVHSEAA